MRRRKFQIRWVNEKRSVNWTLWKLVSDIQRTHARGVQTKKILLYNLKMCTVW